MKVFQHGYLAISVCHLTPSTTVSVCLEENARFTDVGHLIFDSLSCWLGNQ